MPLELIIFGFKIFIFWVVCISFRKFLAYRLSPPLTIRWTCYLPLLNKPAKDLRQVAHLLGSVSWCINSVGSLGIGGIGNYKDTLEGINISHLAKRKIIFKMPFLGDMLVPWRVTTKISLFWVIVFQCRSLLSMQHLNGFCLSATKKPLFTRVRKHVKTIHAWNGRFMGWFLIRASTTCDSRLQQTTWSTWG